ncbi:MULTISPECIES: hypothetical protein [Actinomadura]|uniref:Uncharacterized protein n=1 Tax=Actinomadura yumaensis TaxID=111807 RepID=A0ABW2CRU7_9ACTN|nr:hypothetical protein [Actinomadura sp. J1-007]MWK34098.1 hypothetical protein [Actinomadura sp. J1-007]
MQRTRDHSGAEAARDRGICASEVIDELDDMIMTFLARAWCAVGGAAMAVQASSEGSTAVTEAARVNSDGELVAGRCGCSSSGAR